MTREQINAEAHKPSKSWIEAGSGPIGKLYFELIGCDELPNMDSGPLPAAAGVLQAVASKTGGDRLLPNMDSIPLSGPLSAAADAITGKSDAYACIIYEDSIVHTDVIYDTLCPRWMPWTQRAFAFNIMHPSSQLMLAILDYDTINPLQADDPIGRVMIDPSNLRPMTDYTMQFDLTTSSLVSNRKTNGTVTLRVRVEWESERKALIKAVMPPPQIYVNVLRQRDFLASHYAIVGEVGCASCVCSAVLFYCVLV